MEKETRTIEEVKIHLLVMNNMTQNMEHGDTVAYSFDRDKLIQWKYDQLALGPWKDEGPNYFGNGGTKIYHKVYRKESILEWYNPINDNSINNFNHGIVEKWIQEKYINPSIFRIC